MQIVHQLYLQSQCTGMCYRYILYIIYNFYRYICVCVCVCSLVSFPSKSGDIYIWVLWLSAKRCVNGGSDFWLSIKSISNTLSCYCFVCAFIIGQYYWGNVLIRHVCEWKHRAGLFSGVEFRGAFHFQKIKFLQLLQIWSSYCFHYDTDQLWTHTQSNNKTKCLKQISLTVKNLTPPSPICAPFGTNYTYIYYIYNT